MTQIFNNSASNSVDLLQMAADKINDPSVSVTDGRLCAPVYLRTHYHIILFSKVKGSYRSHFFICVKFTRI